MIIKVKTLVFCEKFMSTAPDVHVMSMLNLDKQNTPHHGLLQTAIKHFIINQILFCNSKTYPLVM